MTDDLHGKNLPSQYQQNDGWFTWLEHTFPVSAEQMIYIDGTYLLSISRLDEKEKDGNTDVKIEMNLFCIALKFKAIVKFTNTTTMIVCMILAVQ